MPDLYFDYGANLDAAEFRDWCQRRGFEADGMRPLGTAMLADCELVFERSSRRRGGGLPNLRRRVGQVVEGIIFEMSFEGWDVLDARAALPTRRRVHRSAILADGTARTVVTYISESALPATFLQPTDSLVATMRRGLEAHRLGTGMLEWAAAGEPVPLAVGGVFIAGAQMRCEPQFHDVAQHEPSCILLAATSAVLVDLIDAPALSLEGEPGRVRGEYVAVADLAEFLVHLDVLEGALPLGAPGGWRRRTILPADIGVGGTWPAWTYVVERNLVPGARKIESGCWRTHRRRDAGFYRALVGAHAARRSDFRAALAHALGDHALPNAAVAVTRSDQDIAQALAAGLMSERSLADVSGAKAVVPAQMGRASAR